MERSCCCASTLIYIPPLTSEQYSGAAQDVTTIYSLVTSKVLGFKDQFVLSICCEV